MTAPLNTSDNKRRRSTSKLILEPRDEAALQQYRTALRDDPTFNSLQVLNMRGQLKLDEACIQLKPLTYSASENELTSEPFTPGYNLHSPTSAIQTFRRFVAVGDAGIGKSTLLRSLVLLAVNANDEEELPDFPVLVLLPDFVRSKQPRLLDYSLDSLSAQSGVSRSTIEAKLYKGEVLLLFDGLDEIQVADPQDVPMMRREILNQLSTIIRQYPRTAIALTCRRANWREELPGFTVLELAEFGWEDIQDFIRRWMESRRRPELYRKMAQALLGSLGIRSLVATPLLLALLCLAYENKGMLPHGKTELYAWCVEAMLKQAQSARPVAGQYRLQEQYKLALLRKIALHFHLISKREFTHDEILQVIIPFVRELKLEKDQVREVLNELVSEQGLLRLNPNQLYSFVHISMQEYFVAEAIIENQHYDLVARDLLQPWWQEVVVMLAGLGDNDRVLQLIHGAEGDRGQLLGLACRCLANQPPPEVTNPETDDRKVLDLTTAIMAEAMQMVLDVSLSTEKKVQIIESLSQIKNSGVVRYFSVLFQMRTMQLFSRWDLYARVILNLVQLGFADSYPVVFLLLKRPELDSDLKQKLIDAAVLVGNRRVALTSDLRRVLPQLRGDVRAKAVLVLLQRGDRRTENIGWVVLRERNVASHLKRRLLSVLCSFLEPVDFTRKMQPLLHPSVASDTRLQVRALELAVITGGAPAIANLMTQLIEAPNHYTLELSTRLILLAGRNGNAEVMKQLLKILHPEEIQLENHSPLPESLRQDALATIAVLATVEYALILRHWLRNARADYYSERVAALVQTLNPSEDTRAVTSRFLLKNPQRIEIEKQIRIIANETRRKIASIYAAISTQEALYFYGH